MIWNRILSHPQCRKCSFWERERDKSKFVSCSMQRFNFLTLFSILCKSRHLSFDKVACYRKKHFLTHLQKKVTSLLPTCFFAWLSLTLTFQSSLSPSLSFVSHTLSLSLCLYVCLCMFFSFLSYLLSLSLSLSLTHTHSISISLYVCLSLASSLSLSSSLSLHLPSRLKKWASKKAFDSLVKGNDEEVCKYFPISKQGYLLVSLLEPIL